MFRIYVGNLSFETTDVALSELFGQHGTVDNVSIITDRVTGRSRGFAFVEMADDGEGRKAMDAVNGHELEGRTLKVSQAHERAERGGGRG